ncbi:beta-propeller fold lactonase family protein [soil metagenome]
MTRTYVYIANADSRDMTVMQLDSASGGLIPVETVALGGMAMPMALSGRSFGGKRILYAALRSQPYRVVSLAIDPDTGRTTKLGEASLADSMANIDLDRTGRWLFAGSYGGHRITVNAVDAEGRVGAVHQVMASGPNVHAVHVDPANRFVYATSLGADAITSWRFDATTGLLAASDPPHTANPPHTGRRHFVTDAGHRRLYVLCEHDASVGVYECDAERGALLEVQRVSALPPGFEGKAWAADLHLSPGGRHLYASERRTHTIAVFDVDVVSGRLKATANVATEKAPRGFAIDSSGRYLIVAGQESHHVTVHAVDGDSGRLVPLQRYPVGQGPNWIEIATFD